MRILPFPIIGRPENKFSNLDPYTGQMKSSLMTKTTSIVKPWFGYAAIFLILSIVFVIAFSFINRLSTDDDIDNSNTMDDDGNNQDNGAMRRNVDDESAYKDRDRDGRLSWLRN